jgi:hypothetical protein
VLSSMQHQDHENHQQNRLLGSCFVSINIGSSEQLAMQNLQILIQLKLRLYQWLFPSRFSDTNRFTSSHPDAVLVAAKSKKRQDC